VWCISIKARRPSMLIIWSPLCIICNAVYKHFFMCNILKVKLTPVAKHRYRCCITNRISFSVLLTIVSQSKLISLQIEQVKLMVLNPLSVKVCWG
jgi:hypothetical protein